MTDFTPDYDMERLLGDAEAARELTPTQRFRLTQYVRAKLEATYDGPRDNAWMNAQIRAKAAGIPWHHKRGEIPTDAPPPTPENNAMNDAIREDAGRGALNDMIRMARGEVRPR